MNRMRKIQELIRLTSTIQIHTYVNVLKEDEKKTSEISIN